MLNNGRASNDWVNDSRLVDQPGADPGVVIGAAHASLLGAVVLDRLEVESSATNRR